MLRIVLTLIAVLVILNAMIFLAKDVSGDIALATVQESKPKQESNPKLKKQCPSARKALIYYRLQRHKWLRLRGIESKPILTQPKTCAAVRHAVEVAKRNSKAARKAYEKWNWIHYAWWDWLPEKYARVGACETGYGKPPGSWTWDSGTYVSAFGIYRAGYTQFAHAIGLLSWDETRSRLGRYPSPREQYLVAAEIQRRFSWSAWGCGGA